MAKVDSVTRYSGSYTWTGHVLYALYLGTCVVVLGAVWLAIAFLPFMVVSLLSGPPSLEVVATVVWVVFLLGVFLRFEEW